MRYVGAILVAVFALMSGAALARPVNTGHVELELVPAAASIAPGSSQFVALHQKIASGWHTYWRNPGDAGEPPRIGWTLPTGWTSGEIAWPAPPVRLPVGPLMDYGYKGEVYLPIPITAPASARVGFLAQLKADVSLLVCKDICIPEEATLTLDLPVNRLSTRPNEAVAAALATVPRPSGLKAAMALQDGRLKIAVTGPAVKGGVHEAYFFPYDSTVIKHPKPQLVDRGPEGLTLSVEPGYAFQQPSKPTSISGVLAVDGRPFEITAANGALAAGARGLGPPAGAGLTTTGLSGLPLAAGFAFLGGLILNLMPCVFPILSMKALALAGHGAEGAKPRAHGLAFLAGVLATFVGLAAVLLAAKAAGAAVGWGFQLQSPPVVAGLCLLMLLIGLNLSGVYEAGLSLQGAGGHATSGGLIGSALTGALAVVVAAPCTAPFMASAIAFALTQSEWAALTVFAALGLGFASPFVLVSFAPGLRKRLPRPGAWMDGLKKVLAFPMYGAAAWLIWVLTLQAGTTALAALLAAGIVLALAAWIYGSAQRAQALGRRPILLYGLSLAAVLGAAGLTVAGLAAPGSTATASASTSGAALASEPFSPDRVVQLQSQHKAVFVDFTAAWCITCQVNEQVALSSPKVAAAFARTGAVYLKADWTKRDPVIASVLAQHGRAGVPLYLLYPARGGEAATLPQLLTEGAVLDALNKATS